MSQKRNICCRESLAVGGPIFDSTGDVHAAPKDTSLAMCERLGRYRKGERERRGGEKGEVEEEEGGKEKK